ncbi:MAG: hypothetical protein WBD36_09795 [Bacteroidota bacterium]
MKPLTVLAVLMLVSLTSFAQTQDSATSRFVKPERLKLSGPRVGMTLLTGSDADKLKNDFSAGPLVSQFGWQFETQLFDSKEGISGLSEWVALVGGVEQGVLLPSISWLVGIRFPSGPELAVGPMLSLSGAALVIGGGTTLQTSSFNFPINGALVLAKGGTTFSILVGFTTRE